MRIRRAEAGHARPSRRVVFSRTSASASYGSAAAAASGAQVKPRAAASARSRACRGSGRSRTRADGCRRPAHRWRRCHPGRPLRRGTADSGQRASRGPCESRSPATGRPARPRHTPRSMREHLATRAHQPLGRASARFRRQQPEAGRARYSDSTCVRIAHDLAEHLVAAADAQDRRAVRDQPAEPCRPGPASCSQRRSGIVALVPGRMTRSGARSSPAATRSGRATPGSAASGPNSSKLARCGSRTTAISTLRVARRALASGWPRPPRAARRSSRYGTTPSTGTPVRSSRSAGAGASSDGVAAELVEDEAAHQGALVRREPLPRAEQGREGAAAVDVADQQHVGLGMQRHAHVDDVAGAQVDLGRAARRLRRSPARTPTAGGPASSATTGHRSARCGPKYSARGLDARAPGRAR